MNGLAVRTRGLTRRFGRRWALRGVDLDVPRASITAVLGANGTGKTTLLRVLATLLRPTAGEVRVLGEDVSTGGDRIRRGTALMTPAGHLYEELTGLENLRFAARMGGVRPSIPDLRKRLARVGLAEAAERRVRGYSTGMRKRLELARVGLRPLDLVLLDEPLTSLDDEGVELVREAVRSWREAGAAVLIASHRMDGATRLADRAIRLEAGVVVAEGSGEPGAVEPERRGGDAEDPDSGGRP